MNKYRIEFDGYDYFVINAQGAVASFSNIHDAYNAMKEFEENRPYDRSRKTPPAMQWVLEHGQSAHVI